ncbi:mannose-1-phosphate guanylyltransferase/mannose-6-phosphate isomerase [Pararhizobium mangrovi]|uniref:mannose-1-phosphate guanylyltransferase n=1 Tax=Pararhizobium mangrovi TaxID=2590452 RepID=A0A506UCG2_9HYPH|nr:mannose-1-phosphate guanylyltransferase/mannose-6-phosphate isomerase [Pararhizobium mangrovi]TPW30644.1 mannose-1-phosphate guanylyltransferase/mannose-6-phosphate isomerase [Pararhizobium mangrovi]
MENEDAAAPGATTTEGDGGRSVPAGILPIVMAGGSGQRLWPLSRVAYPKQFLKLGGDKTMLQETVARLDGLSCAAPVVVCNEEHRFLAAEQMRGPDGLEATLVLEPVARNTAPALAAATMVALRDHEDPIVLALPADHMLADIPAFHRALGDAVRLAETGRLVTFGIVPERAETGYGYIERGEELDGGYAVHRFVEKPDAQTAADYLAGGRHLWNSGMFVFRASRFLREVKALCPEIHHACTAATADPVPDLDFLRLDRTAFARNPDLSIDHAIMEHTRAAAVVPLSAGWSDVGSFSTLWESREKDDAGNVVDGDVIAIDTHGSLVHAESRLVATFAVDDLVVVETKDAVLVTRRDRAHAIKTLVARLRELERCELADHRVVYRPWGRYDTIDLGDRDRVKRITVDPGCKLSLQRHYHRAEHWVVVHGTARVHRGETSTLLSEDQSLYIPVGEIHTLENPGRIPLELIEVQTGSYLGEDDIERLEDRYGRG